MLRTVKVYGHLAEHCGQSVFEALVRAPADAIKFLLCNFPGLRGLMRDGYYKVAVGSHDLQIADCPEQLHFPLADDDVVKVIPVVSGAGGGVGKILGGAALITAAILLAPTGAGFLGLGANVLGGTFTLGAAASVAIGGVGAALALGGVSQLISPVPDLPSFDGGDFGGGEDRQNLAFQSIGNVDREGVPVPVVYGEMIVGSVVISTDIVAKQIEG
jgi:predicted phage tail protein|tara:strand:- start:3524 stop:4171 length:648 start_codon:yes stop_codon:yes gene_type:complete